MLGVFNGKGHKEERVWRETTSGGGNSKFKMMSHSNISVSSFFSNRAGNRAQQYGLTFVLITYPSPLKCSGMAHS